MSNLDALLTGLPVGTESSSKCLLGRYLQDLQEPYRGALASLLDGDLSAAVVSYRLKLAGLKGSEKTILLHRRGICGCPTEVTA